MLCERRAYLNECTGYDVPSALTLGEGASDARPSQCTSRGLMWVKFCRRARWDTSRTDRPQYIRKRTCQTHHMSMTALRQELPLVKWRRRTILCPPAGGLQIGFVSPTFHLLFLGASNNSVSLDVLDEGAKLRHNLMSARMIKENARRERSKWLQQGLQFT